MNNMQNNYTAGSSLLSEALECADMSKILPVPIGYKLMIRIPKKKDITSGGIVLPEETRKTEETASILGEVIALGAIAYHDPEKFPTGPWCKPGDFVMFRAYSGTRFFVRGEEYRFLNDDQIEAVAGSPEEVHRP
jgi:co-chaperonin GroES (HSP10)